MEFPRVDERLVGRSHRWGYGAEVGRGAEQNEYGGRLVRIDALNGEVTRSIWGPDARLASG